VPLSNLIPSDSLDPLAELLAAGAAAAEQFASDSKAIYREWSDGTLDEWVKEQIPDEYRYDEDAASEGSGLDSSSLGETPPGP